MKVVVIVCQGHRPHGQGCLRLAARLVVGVEGGGHPTPDPTETPAGRSLARHVAGVVGLVELR